MTDKYILDSEGNPVPEPDLIKWGVWLEEGNDRRVDRTELAGGEIVVSTVFLGLDHSFGGDVPILYETMVFGGPLDGDGIRCATREQAKAYHAEWVAKAQEATQAEDSRLSKLTRHGLRDRKFRL